MTPPPTEPSKQPTSAQTPSSNTLKFSKKQLALAFVIAGISDAIGAFITPLPPIGWIADLATALLLFMVLGRQWLLLPGLALEAIPGLGVLPFWLVPPQVADLIVASGTEKQLESHRREITALFCDLRGFTGFSESSDPEDVMALLRDYHAAIGEISSNTAAPLNGLLVMA
jgi:Adenylate and Guanylate cyclase catalytic domain